MKEFLPQMRPVFGNAEREALFSYNFEDGYLTEFVETKKFESALAERLTVSETVAVNNGTLALSIAALSLGIGCNDEVIVPNFTMIATPNAMRLIGAKPIFADIEEQSWCISKASIFKNITNRTKAVVLVSANGRFPTYDVDVLRQELNDSGIFLIEDAAQSLGSFYPDGMPIGTKGNVGTLSFSGPKIISTGQGGLIFSQDTDILADVKRIKDFGREGGGNDYHPYFGINSKFTDLQAIVGICQLEVLDERMERRKEQNKLYEKLLSQLDQVSSPVHDYSKTTPWFMEILASDRDNLMNFLKSKNIGSRPVYPEINKQAIYHQSKVYPVSNYVSGNGLWLPSHMMVTNEHIRYICEQIKDFYGVK